MTPTQRPTLSDEEINLIARNRVIAVRGSDDAPAFDYCVTCEAALRAKDEAVSHLIDRLRTKHGDQCEDLIP